MKPDGVFLSNGPADPAAVTYAIDAAREETDERRIIYLLLESGCGKSALLREIKRRYESHLRYSRCKDVRSATDYDKLTSLSMAVRDLAVDRMIATQTAYLDQNARRVYYLSM